MDNDLLDLADRLCTVVGMIMEDNSLIAVSTLGDLAAAQPKLGTLGAAADDMAALIAAACVLERLG